MAITCLHLQVYSHIKYFHAQKSNSSKIKQNFSWNARSTGYVIRHFKKNTNDNFNPSTNQKKDYFTVDHHVK